ncbi:MAG: DUF3750 domain-containing protein [Pseudomonadota bacterium]
MRTFFFRLARFLGRTVLALALLLAGPITVLTLGDLDLDGDWRTAGRDATYVAPDPRDHPEAIVQVWGARAFRWRGAFGLHTWIALKPPYARNYEVHQVIGWYGGGGRSTVVSRLDRPDREWYGAPPSLFAELRGEAASRAIPKIRRAVAEYPAATEYVVWPGPNSNSFIAHVARQVPELNVDLPPHALGKDYLVGDWVAPTPSNTGYQASLAGLLGITVAKAEGVEVNVLGLAFGWDFDAWALKLPGIGRLSLADSNNP